eukprot:TRINITY_DN2496_c0_g1_i1.p1 TRINITY_DN2496_c0_g1~~TRINITY_DN2496_c0_g1_i1.p1  ORF type:complete len:103 (-),score=1.24 TRINITY_DN2496_c0_g1_i1:169-477(-)
MLPSVNTVIRELRTPRPVYVASAIALYAIGAFIMRNKRPKVKYGLFLYDTEDPRLLVPKYYWWLGFQLNFAQLIVRLKHNPGRSFVSIAFLAALLYIIMSKR